jgi:hypothetical protein
MIITIVVSYALAAPEPVRKTPSHQVSPEIGPTLALYDCIPTGMHGPTKLTPSRCTHTQVGAQAALVRRLREAATRAAVPEPAPAVRLCEDCASKVRKTPSWPRSWANFSLLQLYSH